MNQRYNLGSRYFRDRKRHEARKRKHREEVNEMASDNDPKLPDNIADSIGRMQDVLRQDRIPVVGMGTPANVVTFDAQLTMLLNTSQATLAKVHPILANRVEQMIIIAYTESKLSFGAFMGLRTMAQQFALYAQHREPLNVVNNLRAQAGMPPITAEENKSKVTDLRFGYHNVGLAVDLVEDGDPNKAGIQWSWKSNIDYLKLGKIAKRVGLEWGGFWKSFKDYPHVQLTGGISEQDAKAMLSKDGNMIALWEKVNSAINFDIPDSQLNKQV